MPFGLFSSKLDKLWDRLRESGERAIYRSGKTTYEGPASGFPKFNVDVPLPEGTAVPLPDITSFEAFDGSFNAEVCGELVIKQAMIMATWFRNSPAQNFVTLELTASTPPFESYMMTVQRMPGKTPSEKYNAVAQALDKANAEIVRLGGTPVAVVEE